MNQLKIRRATFGDIPFLGKVVIEAEQSNTDKLSYATLFNIPNSEAYKLIVQMFEEDVNGCEFSVSSYLVAECNDKPVASFGGWIENFEDQLDSSLLKSNLISFTFSRASIQFLRTKQDLIKGILVKREPNTLQLEHLFVSENFRGLKLADSLIQNHITIAKNLNPSLAKVQVQVFANNHSAINVYNRNGFETVKSYKVEDIQILNYLPHNEKYIMEKII